MRSDRPSPSSSEKQLFKTRSDSRGRKGKISTRKKSSRRSKAYLAGSDSDDDEEESSDSDAKEEGNKARYTRDSEDESSPEEDIRMAVEEDMEPIQTTCRIEMVSSVKRGIVMSIIWTNVSL